jgi:hypothetical protein
LFSEQIIQTNQEEKQQLQRNKTRKRKKIRGQHGNKHIMVTKEEIISNFKHICYLEVVPKSVYSGAWEIHLLNMA